MAPGTRGVRAFLEPQGVRAGHGEGRLSHALSLASEMRGEERLNSSSGGALDCCCAGASRSPMALSARRRWEAGWARRVALPGCAWSGARPRCAGEGWVQPTDRFRGPAPPSPRQVRAPTSADAGQARCLAQGPLRAGTTAGSGAVPATSPTPPRVPQQPFPTAPVIVVKGRQLLEAAALHEGRGGGWGVMSGPGPSRTGGNIRSPTHVARPRRLACWQNRHITF